MSRDTGGKPGRSARAGRLISDEDAALWQQVGRTLAKVKKKPRVTAHGDLAAEARPEAGIPHGSGRDLTGTPGPKSGSGRGSRRPEGADQPRIATAARQLPSPPAEIDRRTLRQMASGKVAIDAVLDLHGLNQESAHSRLRSFLLGSQAKGHRVVLVITGKGRSDAATGAWPSDRAERGVLRRSVPLWLSDPEMRAVVISTAPAGPRHGGDGALYIKLRKARSG